MRLPRFRPRVHLAILLGGLLMVTLPSIASSITNTIITPPASVADMQTFTVTPDTLKPSPECDSIALNAMLTGGGTINGTTANELILVSDPTSTVTGGAGSDCIVIGDGVGHVDGDTGPSNPNSPTDVDICIGGVNTIFTNCETIHRI